jgi:uncharacterized membrane protein
MGKFISLILALFVCFCFLNIIFFYESFNNEDIREFYLTGELSEGYSSDEVSHMKDVRTLGMFSLFLNLVLLFVFVKFRKGVDFRKTSTYLFIIFGLLVVFAFLFDNFFYYFHLVFFGSSGWTFPSSSRLIQDYPFEFFRNRFLFLNFLILCSAVVFRGVVFERFSKKPKRN